MKKQSEYSKKLIKNVTALIASGLILIAATFAWFALNDQASVGAVNARSEGQKFEIEYYHLKSIGSMSFHLLDDENPSGQSLAWSLADRLGTGASSWETASSFDVDSLYPGEFDAFKIVIEPHAAASATFVMSNITCTHDSSITDDDVFSNVYVNLIASADNSEIGSFSGSLKSLAGGDDADYESVEALDLGTFSDNSTVTIFMDIGMRGENSAIHANLRQASVSVSIDSIGLSADA